MPQSRRTAGNANNLHKLLRRGLYWTPRLVVIGLVLWIIAWLAVGDDVRYFGYINAGGFIFSLVACMAVLALAFRRDWFWMAVAVILATGILSYGTGFSVGDGAGQKAPATIRVVSASLRGLNRNMDAAAVRLNSYDPDIIAVQEVFEKMALLDALKRHSGHEWTMTAFGPLAVFAKGQVKAGASEPLASVLKTEIIVQGQPITLWTLRAPKSYAQPVLNAGFYNSLGNAIRAERPDLVVGDFNATPWNAGYATISRTMRNAQETSGFGPGNSFPAGARRIGLLGSFVRIDHIFVSKGLVIRNAFTGKASAGADHHPVIADIEMRQQIGG